MLPLLSKLRSKITHKLHIGEEWLFASRRCDGLELEPGKTAPNGGAIALGHPVGCSGAFIATKASYELKRTGDKYALATTCIGGGQGIASIFECA